MLVIVQKVFDILYVRDFSWTW